MHSSVSKPGVGPALALLTATRQKDRNAVYRIADTFGAYDLAGSAIDLAYRMAWHADVITPGHEENDFLWEMFQELSNKYAYRGVIMRYRDRFAFSPARVHAHLIMDEFSVNLVDTSELIGRQERITRYSQVQPTEFVVGLGYVLTIVAEFIAFNEDADLDDRIEAYRSQAARETISA